MAEKDLTFAQLCLLITLMGEAREVPHAHLTNVRKIKLDTKYRRDLEERKLITARKAGRGLSVELTEQGWAVARAQFGSPTPERGGAGGAALYTMLASIGRYFDRSDLAPAEFFLPLDVDGAATELAVADGAAADRDVVATGRGGAAGLDAAAAGADLAVLIRDAYTEIALRPGEMVSLAALRPRLAGAARPDVDAALVALSSAPDVRIIPESNQKTLSPAQREAAVSIGNQDRHLIAIGV
ncbi:hypothetical protein DFJ67_0047 [Asanoa ferruginea]|uniref:Uncharacterized protein n=1 Tax=Asanoa ferruginea TaxID=53367 RepID=A0A3D9ZA25_9ACTN|nr:hypothetical protein [Asanoa ferruginea]REF94135.1 hypothetical protein DFJ67_0047 [Asanoa ferruginea]GIF52638.1 hypothetical protein Afe04nite_71770 [Asanoa ferruginea]